MTETTWRYDSSSYRRLYVVDSAELPPLVAELRTADAVGVDVEMAQRPERRPGGVQEWVQVLALIQVASRSLSVVIDPVRCYDLSPLHPLLADGTRKVFLGGGQDAALLAKAGMPPRHIVDVGEVALAIFGRREDGMAALARRIFGLNLDKTVRRTDWLARPLNPILLAYAHRDAELTLLIYEWFKESYPDVVLLHERLELDPNLPGTTASWLRDALLRSPMDAIASVMEHGLDPSVHSERLAADIRAALEAASAPRQTNRLLRLAGELGLSSLLDDILPLVDSPSSLSRAAAARAVGQLASPDVGTQVLQKLKKDPIEDVRKAADAAFKEMNSPKQPVEQSEEEGEAASSLGEHALSALQQLMRELEGESR